jgi:hypothetical protein
MPKYKVKPLTLDQIATVADVVRMRVQALEEAILEGSSDADDMEELAILHVAATKF